LASQAFTNLIIALVAVKKSQKIDYQLNTGTVKREMCVTCCRSVNVTSYYICNQWRIYA